MNTSEAPGAITTRMPQVVTDGGPWANHDQACAVCSVRPAVLQLWDGVYQTCWRCQGEGWVFLKRRRWRVWRRRV
jgi:hypothetical protein